MTIASYAPNLRTACVTWFFSLNIQPILTRMSLLINWGKTQIIFLYEKIYIFLLHIKRLVTQIVCSHLVAAGPLVIKICGLIQNIINVNVFIYTKTPCILERRILA